MPPVISKPTLPLAAGTRTALATESAGGFRGTHEKSEPASDHPVLPDMADQPDVSDLPEPVAAHTAVTWPTPNRRY